MADRGGRTTAAPVKHRGNAGSRPAARVAVPPAAAPSSSPPPAAPSAARRPARTRPAAAERTATASVPLWVPIATVAICLAGLGVAGYLTAAHYTTAAILACAGNGIVNCTAVTTSPESVIFGIPVAVLGLVFFAVALPFMLPAAWRARSPWVHRIRLGGVITGIGMAAYLVYTELFTIDKICLYCTAVHVLTLLLFAVVVVGTALRGPQPAADVD